MKRDHNKYNKLNRDMCFVERHRGVTSHAITKVWTPLCLVLLCKLLYTVLRFSITDY